MLEVLRLATRRHLEKSASRSRSPSDRAVPAVTAAGRHPGVIGSSGAPLSEAFE